MMRTLNLLSAVIILFFVITSLIDGNLIDTIIFLIVYHELMSLDRFSIIKKLINKEASDGFK